MAPRLETRCRPRTEHPHMHRHRHRHRLQTLWHGMTVARLAVSFTAVVLSLVGPAVGKGSSGITAAQLGKSAAGLAKPSPLKTLEEGVPKAVALAQLEQVRGAPSDRVSYLIFAVLAIVGVDDAASSTKILAQSVMEIEDLNVMHKFDRRLERLAMVMPLTDQFDPGVTHFAHEHLQEGDKISLPSSILSELIRKQAEIPWQFELKLVRRKAPGKFEPVDVPAPPREELRGKVEMPQLSAVACSVLDARSPEQFVFIPDWMMKALRLRPRDIVLYRHKDLTKAATIVLQPHSSAFLKMSNHQAVMETELRHYSAITRGTTVAFRYRKKLYKFNVLECIDTDGKSQETVCVQDSDVATDFQAALDTPEGRRNPRAAPKSSTSAKKAPPSRQEEEQDEDEESGSDSEEEGGWGSDEF